MANEQLSMDSILDDKPVEKPVPAEAPAAATPAEPEAGERQREADENAEGYKSKKKRAQEKEYEARGWVRDPDTGQFRSPDPEKAKEAAAAAPAAAPAPAPVTPVPAAPQQTLTPQERAFLAAAQDERGKRQELERRIAAMEAATPKEPEKGFWDDPEAAMAKQKAEMQQVAVNTRIQTAELIARTAHPDFDEKLAIFGQIVQSAPHVREIVLQQANPAEAAYQMAAKHMLLQQAGGMDKLLEERDAKARADERTKMEAEYKAKAEAEAAQRAALPGSLTDARSTASPQRTWGGPPSMEDILKG